MKILAVDISGLFRTMWEISQGKQDSKAFQLTIEAVARARDGFDRVAVCCDTGKSFRGRLWPEYKANRTDPGEAYRHQLARAVEQLDADGCTVLRAPPVKFEDDTGEAFYAEADDVIATVVGWAVEGGHRVRIYSADKDLLQCVSDQCDRMNFKGEVMGPADIIAKLGIPASLVPDWLALAGDGSDNFKAFPGIGDKTAVALLKAFGSALGVFTPAALERVPTLTKANIAEVLRSEGARERAERCLRVATVLRDVELSLEPLLADPVYKTPPAVSKVDFEPEETPPPAPALAPQPVSHAAPELVQDAPRSPLAIVRRSSVEVAGFNPLALEPTDPKQAWALAQTAAVCQLYKKFPNAEAIMMVIMEGRALGVASVVALKNAYIVKGNVGWSARFLRGLAMQPRHGLCEYFRIVESELHHALAICKRIGDPEFRVLSTTDQAKKRGLVVRDGKWDVDPLSMNVADVERRGARMGWPDVVSGLYTPDELEMGTDEDGSAISRAA